MNWFLAKLVFRIVCGHGNHTPQFDEQLRFIFADDELHAFHKARLIGESECNNTAAGNMIVPGWTFIDVTELQMVTPGTDGAEIYSVIKEEADAELYIRRVKKTATQLLQRGLHQFTAINKMAIGT